MKKLCSLKNQEFEEERWRISIEKQMKKDVNSEFLVALDEKNNQILGMANCAIKNSNNGDRFGYISNLIVIEEKRRAGIGEKLMRHIKDYFKKNHIQSVMLSLKSNLEEGAKMLFIKLGFQEIYRIFELKM